MKRGWHVIADPILLTILSTPILYVLLVRPIWHSLRQRTRAVEAFRKEKNKAQMYLDIAGVILVALDSEGCVTLINRKGSEILGRNEGEILGKNWFDNFMPETERRHAEKLLEQVRAKNTALFEPFENSVLTADSEKRLISWHVAVLHNERGNAVGTLSSGEDITERKRMEEDLRKHREHLEELVQARTTELTKANKQLLDEIARRKDLEKDLMATNEQLHQEIADHKQTDQSLRQTQERFRDFFENAPIGFHIFGPDRKIMDINDAELKMIGCTKDEIVGQKTWADLILPEQRTEFEGHWRDMIAEGQVRSLNYTLVHKDGHHIDVLLNASARFDEEGHLINTRGSVLNIAERRRLERELLNIVERERQRIGQELHDSIGQQLTGVAFMMEVLGEKLADKSSTEEVLYAEKISTRVNQAAELTHNLAKGLHPIDLERDGLAFALQELTDDTKQIFNISCTFKCDKAASVSRLSSPINLYRIAQEAITNAVKHGKAKNIRIEMTSQDDGIRLTVENDGLDFPAGETHAEGMGLKIMRYRAELMNSSLDIRRGCNGGTIISCVLPN
ncbi:MAG: PAS domain-containing sensor histidine kinase [Planctomycetota bacterium]